MPTVGKTKRAEFDLFRLTDLILKRPRMPWLWSNLISNVFPEDREHERCLKIIHQLTKRVIQNRANAFEAT